MPDRAPDLVARLRDDREIPRATGSGHAGRLGHGTPRHAWQIALDPPESPARASEPDQPSTPLSADARWIVKRGFIGSPSASQRRRWGAIRRRAARILQHNAEPRVLWIFSRRDMRLNPCPRAPTRRLRSPAKFGNQGIVLGRKAPNPSTTSHGRRPAAKLDNHKPTPGTIMTRTVA
jgi:hypothetical protein